MKWWLLCLFVFCPSFRLNPSVDSSNRILPVSPIPPPSNTSSPGTKRRSGRIQSSRNRNSSHSIGHRDHQNWGKRPPLNASPRQREKERIAVKIKDLIKVSSSNQHYRGKLGNVEQLNMMKREYAIKFIENENENASTPNAWIQERDLRKSMCSVR